MGGNPERKIHLGRRRSGWEGDIKVGLEVVCEGVTWSDRNQCWVVVSMVITLWLLA
jgi:hypothetical protein